MATERVETEATIKGSRLALTLDVQRGFAATYESPAEATEITVIEAVDLDEQRALTEKEAETLATSDELIDHVDDLFARFDDLPADIDDWWEGQDGA